MKKTILWCLMLALFTMPMSLGTVIAQDDDTEPVDVEIQTEDAPEADDDEGEETPRIFQVNSESAVNARNAPSTTSNVVGVLQPGEFVEVIEAVEGSLVGGNSIWYRIIITGQDGYIHSSLLVPIPTLQNQSVVVELPDSFLPRIIVNTTGSVTVSPNLAIIQFGFEQVGTDTASVYRTTQTAQSDVVAALRSEGIPENDIATTLVTIINEDVLDPAGGVTGEFVFRTQALLTVYISDLEMIQGVVEVALSNGANSIQNVIYTVDDFTEAEDQALLNGLQRSLEQARNIASESLILLGPSILITVSPFTVTTVEDLVNAPQNTQNIRINRQFPTVPDQLVVSVDIQIEYGVRTR
ncbi:MAG: SIMPL domain-containing protein [Anaerolineae bacterium]